MKIFYKKETNKHTKYYFLGIQLLNRRKNKTDYQEQIDIISKKIDNTQTLTYNIYKYMHYNELAKIHHPLIFSKYKDINKGKSVVLYACGPSAKYFEKIKDAVYVGVNRAIYATDIKFSQIFMHDKQMIEENEELLANYSADKFCGFHTATELFKQHGITLELANKIGGKIFFISNPWLVGVDNNCQDIVNPDITKGYFFDRGTVFSALQFILYTNPAKIYLVGNDCTEDGYFYSENGEKNLLIKSLKGYWKKFYHFAKMFYPDIEIISINPVELKGLFKDEYTQSFLNKQKEISLSKKKLNVNVIETIWTNQSDEDELYLLLKSNINSKKYEEIPHKCLLIYFSLLIQNNASNVEIQNVLKNYIKIHGTMDIFRYPIVAKFIKEQNITDEQIEKTVFVWDKLNEEKRLTNFENYIKNKTIAIVGNSGCQIGKNKGEEIDAHDIVIRCNNYPSDEKYHNDYGKKTNVWVRNSANSCIHRDDISSYDYVIWKDDFSHFPIRENFLDIMYDYMKGYPNKLLYINNKYYDSLKKQAGVHHPTSGCIIIWMLYQILGSFKNIDIYGFSFLTNDKTDNGHYFDDIKFSFHDIDFERDFLFNLYQKS